MCVCPHVGRQNFRFHSVAFVFPLVELEQLLLLKAGVEATTTSALTATPATAPTPASTLTCWLCPANFSFSRPVFLAIKKITTAATRTTAPTTTTAADAQKKRLKKPCGNVARDKFLGRREKDASNSRITTAQENSSVARATGKWKMDKNVYENLRVMKMVKADKSRP